MGSVRPGRCPLHWQAPKNNAAFWEEKITGNVRRDAEIDARLRADGWTVIRIWEHEIRASPAEAARALARSLLREPVRPT